jgi:putative membrane-bound dehydrogenase-like protein
MPKLLFVFFALGVFSCQKKVADKPNLGEAVIHESKNALYAIALADSVAISTFATEPMLVNPTNIDIDAKGRVWVCEAYNYRPEINGNPTKPEGDRIVILEDNNQDGKADTSKVFYQGPELNSPIGIAVLGNTVYVSQSPYIWVFTDQDGDDKADKKEILFQGIQGAQHDHGVHAVVFGPDGKLYFTMGNEGKTLRDRNNKPVKTIDGFEINEKNFKQGLTLRCNLDGSQVEVLGHNFRNNYEPAIDSFGNIWQSDNDDDGNRGTRINYLMPHGNYGYTDELTGAGWRVNRTNIEKEIPLQHWHQNDPGTIPNMLQTYAGSPSGMIFYEGNLLPAVFRNQILHAEPGNNVVRAYPTTKNGAGFNASIINIAKDSIDQWFRPVDVCAAPDGSVFVADWYDQGVGGHEAGDQAKGRIYRLAPKGHKYAPKAIDVSSVAGAISGLQSPNQATRFLAYQNLLKFGNEAIPDLEKLLATQNNQNIAARAFWLLVQTKDGNKYVQNAANSNNPNYKIAAIRAAQMYTGQLLPLINKLSKDSDVQVRRECALALHGQAGPQANGLWASLALQHTGADRWYLEALGIGAKGQEDSRFESFLALAPMPTKNKNTADVVWRSRSAMALPYLAQLASNSADSLTKRLRYFRAFDFHTGPQKNQLLLGILEKSKDLAEKQVLLATLSPEAVGASKLAKNSITSILNAMQDTTLDYLDLVAKYQAKDQIPRILNHVSTNSKHPIFMQSVKACLNLGATGTVKSKFEALPDSLRQNLLHALRWVGTKDAVLLLNQIAKNPKYSEAIRKTAYKYISNSPEGEMQMLAQLRSKAVPQPYLNAAVEGLNNSWKKAVREEARSFLGASKASNGKALPSIATMARMQGNIENGKMAFKAYCASCHKVGAEGLDFGPGLSYIGGKLTKEAILTSIIHPDFGVSFGYEGWSIVLKDGTQMAGIIASKTETDVLLKLPGGASQAIKTSQIKSLTKMDGSMMPAGLQESMATQELVDLVTYLKILK